MAPDRVVDTRDVALDRGDVDESNMVKNGPHTGHLKSAMNRRVYKVLAKGLGWGGGVCKHESHFKTAVMH
jgi:hypothetical protein